MIKANSKHFARLLSLCVLMSAETVALYADDAAIVIRQKSGNETILELSTNPVITFEDENMVISSDITRIYVPLADMDSYTVGEVTTGIDAVHMAPRIADGRVAWSGLKPGTPVLVSTAGGQTVCRYVADADGRADVNLSSLSGAVYIISAQGQSFKVIHK